MSVLLRCWVRGVNVELEKKEHWLSEKSIGQGTDQTNQSTRSESPVTAVLVLNPFLVVIT